MAFKFSLRERMSVPGTDNKAGTLMIQGLVTARRDSISREPQYQLEWKDAVGNDAAVWFDESTLIAANAAVTKPRDIARKLRNRKR